MNDKHDYQPPNTLAIDIGGSAIKAMIIDATAKPLTPYLRHATPRPATVKAVCALLKQLITQLAMPFERVSAGFPGVVKKGVVLTAVNMHPSWLGFNFQKALEVLTERKARVGNDADIQGYGDVSGEGVELVITLGTGVGSALFLDGKLVPNLELGHHPFKNNHTYEALLGKAALQKHGLNRWRKHLQQAIALWMQTFNCDKLYLGGGHAQLIHARLPAAVIISDNVEGVLGGIKLWET